MSPLALFGFNYKELPALPLNQASINVKVAWSRRILCDPMGYTVDGILQTTILECSLSLLQGIFPTQGLNPGLPHCRLILSQLAMIKLLKITKCSSLQHGPGEHCILFPVRSAQKAHGMQGLYWRVEGRWGPKHLVNG